MPLSDAPEWYNPAALQPYAAALAEMQNTARAIIAGTAPEAVWMLEHPPVFTGGTSADDADLIATGDIQTIRTGRGGEWTYHGPGQLVVWPLLKLSARGQDLRAYIHALEGWIIDVLACFNLSGVRRHGLPGVWIRRENSEVLDKIAAIGVRISKWVTMHGFAINLDPDLSAFQRIVPCGINDGGTTSFADLGLIVSRAELEMAVQDCFGAHFGPNAPLAIR